MEKIIDVKVKKKITGFDFVSLMFLTRKTRDELLLTYDIVGDEVSYINDFQECNSIRKEFEERHFSNHDVNVSDSDDDDSEYEYEWREFDDIRYDDDDDNERDDNVPLSSCVVVCGNISPSFETHPFKVYCGLRGGGKRKKKVTRCLKVDREKYFHFLEEENSFVDKDVSKCFLRSDADSFVPIGYDFRMRLYGDKRLTLKLLDYKLRVLDHVFFKFKAPRYDILNFLFVRKRKSRQYRMQFRLQECIFHKREFSCYYEFYHAEGKIVSVFRCLKKFCNKEDLLASVYAEIVMKYYVQFNEVQYRKKDHYGAYLLFYQQYFASKSDIFPQSPMLYYNIGEIVELVGFEKYNDALCKLKIGCVYDIEPFVIDYDDDEEDQVIFSGFEDKNKQKYDLVMKDVKFNLLPRREGHDKCCYVVIKESRPDFCVSRCIQSYESKEKMYLSVYRYLRSYGTIIKECG